MQQNILLNQGDSISNVYLSNQVHNVSSYSPRMNKLKSNLNMIISDDSHNESGEMGEEPRFLSGGAARSSEMNQKEYIKDGEYGTKASKLQQ